MRSTRSAYTLIELLVVIAILGVLLSLTLAAVQKIRTAADRARCQDNLRQLGLALHHYNDTHSHLPSGVCSPAKNEPLPFLSWCGRILPYLEQDAFWQKAVAAFASDKDFLHSPPHDLIAVVVPRFTCPSDPRVREPKEVGDDKALRAFTSYLGVNGTSASVNNGTIFADSRIKFSEISDGLSNTVIVGERPPSFDFVFGWWYAGWGQDQDGECDVVLGTRTKNTSIYGRPCDEVGPFKYAAASFDKPCASFHFWSPHSGGANFVLADGSVRFVRYAGEDILSAMATRAGGESLNLE